MAVAAAFFKRLAAGRNVRVPDAQIACAVSQAHTFR